jgi:hypothetical protein
MEFVRESDFEFVNELLDEVSVELENLLAENVDRVHVEGIECR